MSIRVAHIIDSLGIGGAEQALLSLSAGLKRSGIEVVVIPVFQGGALEPEYFQTGVEVIQIPFSNKWNILRNTLLLSRCLKENNIQLAHAHLFFSGIYLGLSKFLKLSIKRVISFHNLAYERGCNPKSLSYFLRKTLNWIVLRHCYDHFFAVSNAVAQHYVEHFSLRERKLSILPNGIAVENYNSDAYSVEHVEKQLVTLRLVALGRLVKEKGYDDLLHALSILEEDANLSLELVIIGGGPLDKELRSKASELNISEKVIFTGRIDHEKAMAILSTADVFVSSSIFEGFGIAIAEAALLNKLIVATKVGGVTDIVNSETAILVNPGNPEELAEGILQAIQMDKMELGSKLDLSKRKVIDLCSIDAVVARLVDTYYSLLSPEPVKQ